MLFDPFLLSSLPSSGARPAIFLGFFSGRRALARYEHLPIYKEAFDLALCFEKTVRGMGRYDKYTLGTDLRNLSRDVLRLIQRANSEEDRIATLKEVRSKVEELKVVLMKNQAEPVGSPLPAK